EDVIATLFFEKLMSNIQPLAEAKNIPLELFLEDSLDRIYVHPKDMAFALMSLLSRAINFSDKGVINLLVKERDTGNSDIIRIENPEETIKPDQHESMVQSFIKGTDKVKNIIEAHGGKFWLETEQGFAMVFTIPKHLESML
ncbi:MAG: ATP-binding protein, partial [Candidatus Margulisiibacteriota bacterium]